MDDRELLELAAKAAGGEYRNEAFWINGDPAEYCWNPLEDDAHAFRLAVKLEMEVYHGEDCDKGVFASYLDTCKKRIRYCAEYYIDHDGDPYAATRRAIVRAAAEIGKNMS